VEAAFGFVGDALRFEMSAWDAIEPKESEALRPSTGLSQPNPTKRRKLP
jgi:hypothetical protein